MVCPIPEGLDFTIRLPFVLMCSTTTLIQHAWIQVPEFETDPFVRQAYVSLAQIWPIDNLTPLLLSLSSHVFACMFALSIGNIFCTCMGTFISRVMQILAKQLFKWIDPCRAWKPFRARDTVSNSF